MKGERTIKDKPFRFGGFYHNFDNDAEQWAKDIPAMKRCWCCGGVMRNVRSIHGTLLHIEYPYVAVFKISKGRDKGKTWFRTLCRTCAYGYGLGVIEMDGETYQRPEDFNEAAYKKKTKYRWEGFR